MKTGMFTFDTLADAAADILLTVDDIFVVATSTLSWVSQDQPWWVYQNLSSPYNIRTKQADWFCKIKYKILPT